MIIYFLFSLFSLCSCANDSVSVVETQPLCNPDTVLQVNTSTCINATGIESEIFPKCCLPGYSYQANKHHCVRSVENNYFSKWKYLRIGLRSCKSGLIKDSRVGTLPDFSYGDRCFDKLADEDGFVQRVCQDVRESVCNASGIQCIRKCCPDLEVFSNGPHCRGNIEKGVNFYGSKKIEISTGKSAARFKSLRNDL